MWQAPWWQEISTLRFNRDEYLSLITTGSPARDDDSGRQHTVIRRETNYPKRCPAPRHFDRSEAEWRNLTPKCGKPRVAGDLSTLRFNRVLSPCHPYRRVSPSSGRKVQRHNLLFPLEGKCRAASKGCTRLRVEMKRKGCPDRQTAACQGECHLRLLPYSTPAPLCGPLRPGGKRVT